MSTVYVIQEQPRHDISPALEYGKIEVLLPPGDFNFSQQAVCDTLIEKLKSFGPEDWLLLTGDPSAIAMVGSIVTLLGWDLRMLKWNKNNRKYIPVIVEVPDVK